MYRFNKKKYIFDKYDNIDFMFGGPISKNNKRKKQEEEKKIRKLDYRELFRFAKTALKRVRNHKHL